MRHTASLSAMLLSGALLMPAGARGQSHDSAVSSTAPAWVEHTWEEGSHVLPYAIDVNDEDEVYVTKVVQDTAYHDPDPWHTTPAVSVKGGFIIRYDADGSRCKAVSCAFALRASGYECAICCALPDMDAQCLARYALRSHPKIQPV